MTMRHWDEVASIADAGNRMADWLEGSITSRPADHAKQPDVETRPLIPTLAACNRAGFLTDASQPGYHGRGHDGRTWTQLPFVSGFVSRTNRQLVDTLQREGRRRNLVVIIDGQRDDGRPGGVPVTFAGREVITHAGGAACGGHLRYAWSELPAPALADVLTAHEVTLIDLKGKRRTCLWTMLDQVAGRSR